MPHVAGAAGAGAAKQAAPMPIVDCHAHRHSDGAARYPVRHDPSNPPPGTGMAEHLRAESRAAGVVAIRAI